MAILFTCLGTPIFLLIIVNSTTKSLVIFLKLSVSYDLYNDIRFQNNKSSTITLYLKTFYSYSILLILKIKCQFSLFFFVSQLLWCFKIKYVAHQHTKLHHQLYHIKLTLKTRNKRCAAKTRQQEEGP